LTTAPLPLLLPLLLPFLPLLLLLEVDLM